MRATVALSVCLPVLSEDEQINADDLRSAMFLVRDMLGNNAWNLAVTD
jgi:hypothetical protein